MEYVLLITIIVAYLSLSSKIDKLKNNIQDKKLKHDFPSLKDLIGKNIAIEVDEEAFFNSNPIGILKEYNDTWLVLESYNKKNQKELYYYRLNNIISINIIES
ncbi:MAG: hypothetical protein HFI87_05525 [Bacilli bacterium]|nr:hypothetical protein [Bacilli bacterium]